jgi:hypothetical protein
MIARPSRQLGVTTWTLPERGAAGLAWAHGAGFGRVHIDVRDVAIDGPDTLRAAAEKLDIHLVGVAAVELEAVGIAGHDAKACVSHAIELCSRLEIGYLYLPSFGAAMISSESDLQRTAELLRHTIGMAKPRGIVIATENTLRVDELPRLFERVGEPSLELLFDTQNPALLAQSAPDIARAMARRIRSFAHFKDGAESIGDRRLGDGIARVEESVDIILRGGFSGTFMLENDYREGDRKLAREDQERLLAMIRRADSDADELVS